MECYQIRKSFCALKIFFFNKYYSLFLFCSTVYRCVLALFLGKLMSQLAHCVNHLKDYTVSGRQYGIQMSRAVFGVRFSYGHLLLLFLSFALRLVLAPRPLGPVCTMRTCVNEIT